MSLQKHYRTIDLSLVNLNPFDIFEFRSDRYFEEVFFEDKIHSYIAESIKNNQITFITGNPLAGKTRSVYDTFKTLSSGKILIPYKEENITEYTLPTNTSDLIVFLDDIDDYCYSGNPALNKLLYFIVQKNIKCVITCRTGPEFYRFKNYIHRHAFTRISYNRFHIKPIKKNNKAFQEFCKKNGNNFKSSLQYFDGNIGSVMLPLEDMTIRFEDLVKQDKSISLAILLGLKLHFHLLNYEGNKSTYSEINIKKFCEKFLSDKISEYEWDEAKNILISDEVSLNFIECDEDIYIEEAYLDFSKNTAGFVTDVVHKKYNYKALIRLFHKLYKSEEKRAYGFPMNTRDYNNLIKISGSYDEGKKLFDLIQHPLKKDSYSYTYLMDLTIDKEVLISLYSEMKKKGIKTLYVPHVKFINKFKTFEELLNVLLQLEPKIAETVNDSTKKLVKLAILDKKKSLSYLFEKIPNHTIYNKPSLNRILRYCCEDDEDFKNYLEPAIYLFDTIDYPLRKNLIKTIAKLKKYEIAEKQIKKHLIGFDLFNELGNITKHKSFKKSFDYFIESLDLVQNIAQEQKALSNANRVLFENFDSFEKDEYLNLSQKSHHFLKVNYESLLNLQHTNILQTYLISNDLLFTSENLLDEKIVFLLKKQYLYRNAFREVKNVISDDKLIKILTEKIEFKE